MTMNAPAYAMPASPRDIVPIRFGLPPAREPETATIGFKAYNLWRMARLGLPVPHALVISTGYCQEFLVDPAATAADLRTALAAPLRDLEIATGLRFGRPASRCLCRSAPAHPSQCRA